MSDINPLDDARREAHCLTLDIRDALSFPHKSDQLRLIADAEGRLAGLRRDLEAAARARGRKPRNIYA